jgi:hypothetical protein
MSKGQFGVRIANDVIDPKHSEKGEKRFETGKHPLHMAM